MKLHEDILNQDQKELLGKLAFLSESDLFMGGGTALALQLGHRTSVDFDLYSKEKFDVESLKNLFLTKIPEISVAGQHEDGTLQMRVLEVDVSVFYYPYKLISELVQFYPVKLAAMRDIAASKIAAVVQRARRRDFFDIYYLSKELGFDEVLRCAFEKFPWYSDSQGIVTRALTYFDEAEGDDEADRVRVFDRGVDWNTVKGYLEQEVKMLS